ncbi:EscU/YscU/HrcU family type III secretion system export apparatus switch protein [Aliikangiella sp. IMCC44359]|uniref:EscU/YscU/HrcU family type III secretion system export apparatus switch protein n=1 Tax=Aliikangiella sp. IMCC44359 TaxID=3459125 RepID=UPI00403ADFD4
MKKPESPQSKAAALKYDGKNAPKLVAKGQGQLAQKIIETAKKNDIHIHNDPILLEVLARLELGDEIPHSLYLAVAKIIAFAYFLQGKHPDYENSPHSPTPQEENLLNHTQSPSGYIEKNKTSDKD